MHGKVSNYYRHRGPRAQGLLGRPELQVGLLLFGLAGLLVTTSPIGVVLAVTDFGLAAIDTYQSYLRERENDLDKGASLPGQGAIFTERQSDYTGVFGNLAATLLSGFFLLKMIPRSRTLGHLPEARAKGLPPEKAIEQAERGKAWGKEIPPDPSVSNEERGAKLRSTSDRGAEPHGKANEATQVTKEDSKATAAKAENITKTDRGLEERGIGDKSERTDAAVDRSCVDQQKEEHQSINGITLPPNLGQPQANGYYQMPDPSQPPGLYGFNSGTPPRSRCGTKELIGVIYTAAVKWREKYPDSTILVGDLNESEGHASHMNGIDVDIYTSNKSAANTSGDSNRSIELAKMFVDTGIIDTIGYQDNAVISAIAAYTKEKNLPGKVSPWDGHANHFHVRIDKKYKGPSSGSCAG